MSSPIPPPSRESNPFATCWTGAQSARYVASAGRPIATLLNRLERLGWRGQIVGPHGAGKSIVLRELRAHSSRGDVRFVEGFERRPRWARALLAAWWRLARRRVVVTTHARQPGLPVIARVRPSERALAELFRHHTASRRTPVTLQDALAAFHRSDGDLRAVWLELHLLHERRVRGGDAEPRIAVRHTAATAPSV